MANALPLSWQNEYEHDSQSMINNFHLPFSEPEYSAPKENHASTWQIEDNFLQQPNPAKYHEATYQTPPNTSQAPRVQQPPSFHSVPSNNPQVVRSPLDPHVQVHLHDLQLWDSFSAAQTEMIVTKTGRRMFPGYRVKMSGMDPNAQYCVLMDISSVDENRYKFQHGEWVIAGRGEPHIPQRFYLHPNSPCTGQQWMENIVSFHKVKLTNSGGNCGDGKFLVHTMHRYQPRVHIVQTDDVNTLHLQPMSTFAFPQTSFTTVTAYQNGEIAKLKIANNPYARGFREDGAKTMKAKSTLASFTRPVPTTHKRRCSLNTTSPNSTKRMKLDYAPAVYDQETQPTSWYQPSEQCAPSGYVYGNHVDHQTIQPTNLYPSLFAQSYDANAYHQLCSEAPYDMTAFHQPCYVSNQLSNSIQSVPTEPKSMHATNEPIYVRDYVENRQCSEQQFDQFNYHNESPNITEPPPTLYLNTCEATKPTSSYRTSLSSTDEGYFSSGSPDAHCFKNIDSMFTLC